MNIFISLKRFAVHKCPLHKTKPFKHISFSPIIIIYINYGWHSGVIKVPLWKNIRISSKILSQQTCSLLWTRMHFSFWQTNVWITKRTQLVCRLDSIPFWIWIKQCTMHIYICCPKCHIQFWFNEDFSFWVTTWNWPFVFF